jgi:Arylsulfotransferase (ASST)
MRRFLLVAALAVPLSPASNAATTQPTRVNALQPPPVIVRSRSDAVAPGYLFVAPKSFGASALGILDGRGRFVWVDAIPNGEQATDFRVQSYRGQPVLTWWQGKGFGGLTSGADYIMDSSYRVIATLHPDSGLDLDGHEFRLTPEGTALTLSYHVVPYDLSSVGGPRDAQVTEGVIEELAVPSGHVLWQWHSLDHVPVVDSYFPVESPYDYFHVNSISYDTDGNLLLSARGTSTVYKIDRRNGVVIWRLGGKRSDFVFGPGARFTGQHDAIAAAPDVIRLFDNGTDGATQTEPQSRVIWINLDEARRIATLARQLTHPKVVLSQSQGNAETLANGDTLVGWGSAGEVSEFDPQGKLLFDAQLVGRDTYRAYRLEWSGKPDVPPLATARRSRRRALVVHAIWNGATGVAHWKILTGGTAAKLVAVRTVPWNGFDTTAKLTSRARYAKVVALDSSGTAIGESPIVLVR